MIRKVTFCGHSELTAQEIAVLKERLWTELERNQYMVAQADFVIAYVNYGFGGVVKTLRYAKTKRKPIIQMGSFCVK